MMLRFISGSVNKEYEYQDNQLQSIPDPRPTGSTCRDPTASSGASIRHQMDVRGTDRRVPPQKSGRVKHSRTHQTPSPRKKTARLPTTAVIYYPYKPIMIAFSGI